MVHVVPAPPLWAIGAVPLLFTAGASNAAARCINVTGTYVEHDASTIDCSSPVGLCIAGEYRGDIRGAFAGTANTIVATADTASTAIRNFTSDSVIQARIGRRSGTLIMKNAGSFRTAGLGSNVDLQTIVGGTGDYNGATGDLRAQGTFSQVAGGMSHYTYTVVVQRKFPNQTDHQRRLPQ